jgi:hypothetical protein
MRNLSQLLVLVLVALVAAGTAAQQPAPGAAEPDCATLGGECMEGCEPGFRSIGPSACYDSVCCVRPDQSDPVVVLAEVFAAARSGEVSGLAHLCAPGGDADRDVLRICGLATDETGLEEFSTFFRAGQISGEPTIEGERAAVPFLFGPDGTRPETMNLVQREGLWYLQSF